MAASGDVEGFWRARQAQGDPIAAIALSSLHPSGGLIDSLFGGQSLNDRLEAFSRVYTEHGADLDAIRAALMNAHIVAVDRDMLKDKEGTKGPLNPGQIYDYHRQVFGSYGLPSTTFGATPFTGSRWETYLTWPLWCWGCDRQ